MKAAFIFIAFFVGFAISQTDSQCPVGTPIVQCFVDPCANTPSSCAGYNCVADYCGGCNAKYFTPEGIQVNCRNTNRTCNVSECGLRPLSVIRCSDGSLGGITGRCLYNPETERCSWEYRTCPCPPVCLIYCPYGNVKDENGCPICRCNDPPPSCPTICPELNCTDSYIPEGGCCPKCRPIDCRAVLCRRVEPCMKGYEAVQLPGQCCKRCVPIEKCNEKQCREVKCGHGQQRIKRGCCYVCEPRVNCSAVSCLQVLCRVGYKRVVPEGECCPQCVRDNQCDDMKKAGYHCSTNCSSGYQLMDIGKCCPYCRKIGRCETVRCAAPNCDERFWVYHKGSCCASCPVCEDNEQYSCTVQGEPVCRRGYYKGRNCSMKVSDDERKMESMILRVCSNNTRCPGYSEQEIKVYVARRSNVTAENIRIHRIDIQRPGCCVRYRVNIAAEKSDDFDVKKARDDIQSSVNDSEFEILPPIMAQTSAGSKISWLTSLLLSATKKATCSFSNQILQTNSFSQLSSLSKVLNGGKQWIGKKVKVAGWVKTVRIQGGGRFGFVELNDGSCLRNLQIVVNSDVEGFSQVNSSECGISASIVVEGDIVESLGSGQPIELKASKVQLMGKSISIEYPFAKKGQKMETMRMSAHLRPRTNTIGAVSRVKNALAFATHSFFQNKEFLYLQTPIITASDCEGGGELFQITTLLKQGNAAINEVPIVKGTPKIDYSKDFFGKPAFLTVSGQLNGEMYASALSKIYTFGPTFRAEKSDTNRHIAEFWMIEPEVAFADLTDISNLAEEYIKYCMKQILDKCTEDIAFLDQYIEKGLSNRLQHILANPFERISYTEAVELLKKSGENFRVKVDWGIDLQTEHERYLTEKIFKKPVILFNYPKEIKAFYMRLNEDNKTVSAMDVLVPKIGEIVGGSQREERLDVLEKRLDELKMNKEAYKHYLDLRRFGSVVHSGFGVGFERLAMMVTGIENIRDVIAFPRYPGHAEF